MRTSGSFAMPRSDPAKAVQVLDLMLAFFNNGKRWTRRSFIGSKGRRCLIGALAHIRDQHAIQGDGAEHYLREITGTRRLPDNLDLMTYNDHCKNFQSLRSTIIKARGLAQAELAGTDQREADSRGGIEALCRLISTREEIQALRRDVLRQERGFAALQLDMDQVKTRLDPHHDAE
jgi:hypothetical protein